MNHLFLGASVAAVLAFRPMAWAQTADQASVTTSVTTPADPTLAVSDTVIVPVVPQLEMVLRRFMIYPAAAAIRLRPTASPC